MDYFGKKMLLKAIVEILNELKSKRHAYITARKIRYILERKLNYNISSNLLSHFISTTLDWLVASEYLILIKRNSPKKYKIPDEFLVNSKNLRFYY